MLGEGRKEERKEECRKKRHGGEGRTAVTTKDPKYTVRAVLCPTSDYQGIPVNVNSRVGSLGRPLYECDSQCSAEAFIKRHVIAA
jgi:hypothetical protein